MKYPSSFATLPNESSFGNLPNANQAIAGWEVPIALLQNTTTNNQGNIVQNIISKASIGVVQPLSPQELEIKPEGERSFEWLQVHIRMENFNLNITTGDKIQWQNKQYTIMNDLGYDNYGHKHFHICSLVSRN